VLGITGANAARYLVESGKRLDIVLLEAREVCYGATGRNGGHVQPLLFDRTPDVASFELKNCDVVEKYIRENDVPCEYRSVKACHTFWTERLFAEASADVKFLQKEDPGIGKRVSIVTDSDGLQKNRVKTNCNGVIMTTGAASLWPYKLVAWMMRRMVEEKKINLQTHTTVESITQLRTAQSPRAEWASKPRM